MMGHEIIYLLHIFIVAPLFMYIGHYKENTPQNVIASLLPMGVFISIYHSYKLYTFIQSNQGLETENKH